MKCSDLGEEQHVVLREIERGRVGKRFGRSITTVAERLQRTRSEVATLCEELQDLKFVRLPGSGAVEVLVGCECVLVPRGQAGGQAGRQAGASKVLTTSTSQVVREQEHLRCSRSLPAGNPASGKDPGFRQEDLRAVELGLRNTSPGPAPIAWDEPEPTGQKSSRGDDGRIEPEALVRMKSRRKLNQQKKRWYPVDRKWTGHDLATYFTFQVVAFYPGRESRVPVEILAKQLREWMKIDESVDPPLIKAMIDKFVEDPRNVDSSVPSWKSFLNARKRLLRAIEEQGLYETDAEKVSEALDAAAAELLAH